MSLLSLNRAVWRAFGADLSVLLTGGRRGECSFASGTEITHFTRACVFACFPYLEKKHMTKNESCIIIHTNFCVFCHAISTNGGSFWSLAYCIKCDVNDNGNFCSKKTHSSHLRCSFRFYAHWFPSTQRPLCATSLKITAVFQHLGHT